ncbi:MAG TPA: orotidine-5'-phosphate decarboxylase [Gemmatimonadaceae bacterium]|nr:orotidine-5'-phosphate decarboxylase [Gemmatimonadaceae bacterium]
MAALTNAPSTLSNATTTTPIVALDVSTAEDAIELVDYLGERCRFYKVGNELFTAAGPAILRELRARGCDVFLDLKFHDIPNTVAGGVRNAAHMGARLVTVHGVGGVTMLRAAAEAARDASGDACGVLAVTVLTSLTAGDVARAWGRDAAVLDVSDEVLRLADLAKEAGVHGVVCSGREASRVRERHGVALAVLVPGVRPAGGAVQDQARVVTPAEAGAAGARYVVVGRMVTAASDRRRAMDEVVRELASGR